MDNKIKETAFISKSLNESYIKLKDGKFEDKKLYDFITRAIEDLIKNPYCGLRIPRQLWPKEYSQNFNINNLWKYNLPNAWRLIYTLSGNEIKIVSIILEWMTHKEYERRFHY